MLDTIREPWPWWVAGPLIGLVVPMLQLMGRSFGVSSNLCHICAALLPGRSRFLRYDWRSIGAWNLFFATGIVIGGAVAGRLLAAPGPMQIAPATVRDLTRIGIHDFSGIVPPQFFAPQALASLAGVGIIVLGGFCIGFGTRYAGGCTSGHAITGLSQLQAPSLVAVIAFFVGGLMATHLLLPLILGGLP